MTNHEQSTLPLTDPEGLDPHSWVGVREAAELTGLSDDTIHRDIKDGRYSGAVKVDGQWRIPVVALVDAGRLPAERLATASHHIAGRISAQMAQSLQVRNARLEATVETMRAHMADNEVHLTALISVLDRILGKEQ